MVEYNTDQKMYPEKPHSSPSPSDYISYRNNHLSPKVSQQEEVNLKQINWKCFTSPQVNNLEKEDLMFHKTPHPNSDLVTPFLKLFHWSFLVPDVIVFDQETGTFYCKKGRVPFKILSYIWLFLMVIYLSLLCFNDVSTHINVKVLVGKITWLCYTLFDITVIKCLRMNGDKIAKLLTEGNKISCLCERIASHDLERPTPKKKTNYSKCIILVMCLLSVVYTILFVFYVITELTAATTNLYYKFMDFTSSGTDDVKAEWRNGQNVRSHLLETYTSSTLGSVILTLWLLMAFGVEIIWVIFLAMAASFGYYFNRILTSCIHIIETNQIETCEGIRIFTKITLLLEDFNQIFGSTLLWIVIASIMYTTATLGEFLAGVASNEFIYDVLNVLGHLPFIATLYTASQLHQTGQILPTVMKRQFLHLDVKDQNQMFQVLQGTNIVQHDALSNNIGFKLQYFVIISYPFIAQLVGLIITYSLVAVQFKLGEISIES